jgi:hypothetical protein
MRLSSLSALFWVAIFCIRSFAEAPAQTVQTKTLAVLPTTDTSGYQMGQQVQYSLSSLYQQTQYYQVSMGNAAVTGYTEPEVAKAFQTSQTQIISFAYLEKERISLFLMDSTRPKEFIVVAEGLVDPSLGNQVTPQVVDYKLKLAFNNLLTQFYQLRFQPLPGSQQMTTQQMVASYDPNDPKRRAEEARKLYRELASIQETNTYLGATIGMARYSGTAGSASTVNFGGFVGTKAGEKLRAEFGMDIFRYVSLYGAAKYRIPFAEKYLSLHAGATAGALLIELTPARDELDPVLKAGSLVFGPTISFDIPLLGAYIRGEMKFLFGGGSVLFASYGLSYNI